MFFVHLDHSVLPGHLRTSNHSNCVRKSPSLFCEFFELFTLSTLRVLSFVCWVLTQYWHWQLRVDLLLRVCWDSANQKRFASGRSFAHNIKKSRSFTCLANQNKGISHVTFENQNSTFLQRKPKHSRSVWKPLRSKISQYSRWIRPWKRPPLFRPPIQRPQKRA